MTYRFKYTILTVAVTAACSLTACKDTPSTESPTEPPTTKRERNFIKKANEHYAKEEYSQAEVANKKALAENPSSSIASFNLASSLSRQAGADDSKQLIAQADSIFADLAKNSTNTLAAEKSYYNLGNRAFDGENYQESIEMYKNALRRDPSDDKARENLRLAQLKLQQQQQENKNQDQDQQQDQQEQKEQEKQQQEQQNQQNQDKNQEDQQQKQDQQQQDQQQQQGNKRPDDKNNQKQDRKNGGMSQSNAEQILKAMENEENATRRRVEAQQKADRERQSGRRNVEKPW